MKPLIGITSNFIDDDEFFMKQGMGSRGQLWSAVANDYIDAVIDAGGIPVVIPVTNDDEYNEEIVKKLDGILFTGGADIDSNYAGQRATAKVGRVFAERDAQEMFLMDYVYNATEIPILCVCRGIQLLNVYFGGELILDIPSEGYLDHTIVNNKKYIPSHEVNLKDGSVLREIYKEEVIYVNSFHHQAASKLGEELVAVGYSEDEVIEAIEHRDIRQRFIAGVQWHPEMMAEVDEDHLNLFRYIINEAKNSSIKDS